ncbi:MAG: fluoride efflux transporter CrcB [Kiloniellaceae bacterium]
MILNNFVAVGVGAALGAWARWGLGYLLNAVFPTLPLGTLVANWIGGYLIGFAIELFATHGEVPPEARLFVITGFMGALTTFSTFSAEAVTLITRQQYGWVFVHIASHLTGSIVLTILGILTAKWLTQ